MPVLCVNVLCVSVLCMYVLCTVVPRLLAMYGCPVYECICVCYV